MITTDFDVEKCLAAFRSGDTEQLAMYLANDFTFSGVTPQPQPAAGFFAQLRLLFGAFPDLNWQLEVGEITEEGFVVTTQTTGAHTKPLDLSTQGFGVMEPTGRRFTLPAQEFRWSIRDGKVASIQAEPTDGTGIQGILAQLQLMPSASK